MAPTSVAAGESVVLHAGKVSASVMASLTSTTAVYCYEDVDNGGHGRCTLLVVDSQTAHTPHIDKDAVANHDASLGGSQQQEGHQGQANSVAADSVADSGRTIGKHTPHTGDLLMAAGTITVNRGGLTAPLAVTRVSDTAAAVCYRDENNEGACKLLTVNKDQLLRDGYQSNGGFKNDLLEAYTSGLLSRGTRSLRRAAASSQDHSLKTESSYLKVGGTMGSGGKGSYMSLTSLSEGHVAWCYSEAGDASGACQELQLVEGSWEVASEVVRFNSQGTTLYLTVAALTTRTAALCYLSVQASEFSECKVVDFASGQAGPAMPLTSSAAAHYLSMVPLTSAAVALCYADGANGNRATCRTLSTPTEGGDVLVAGAALVQSVGAAHYTSLSLMSGNTALLCYRDGANSWEGRCLPLNGRGDGALVQGCAVKVGLGSVWHIGTAGLSARQGTVCYQDESTGSGTCNLLTGISPYECSATGEKVSSLAAVLASPSPPPSPPPPSVPPLGVTIANDPKFVGGGVHKHFWLPTGKMTPLMAWSTSRGTPLTRHPRNSSRLVLSGETFGHGPTQWFSAYALHADGKEVLRLGIADRPTKASRAAVASAVPWRKLHTLRLWVDGQPVTDAHTTVASALVKGLTVRASVDPSKGPHGRIGDLPAEVAEIAVPGLTFAISSGSAKKYERESARARWAHLNLRMKSNLPPGASGLIAELAGLQPLSVKTMAYLSMPKLVSQHRTRKRARAVKAELAAAKANMLQARAELEEAKAAEARALLPRAVNETG